MAEIATLGFAVDSSGLDKGTASLNRLSVAANQVEASANKAASAVSKTGQSVQQSNTKAASASQQLAKHLDQTARAAERFGSAGSAANDNIARLERTVGSSVGTFRNLISVLGPLAGLFSINALVGYADAWSDMQSRVGAAVKNMEAAPALMQRLVDIANASYAPLSQTVEVYARNVAVLRDLGRGATEAANFTEALNHALVITATRGERAASVQDALSKAMAVGKLQADGLETVLANGGRVAEVLAKQLGTTVSGLRKMASDGKITGNVIATSLITNLEKLREEAAEMPATIGDAFVRLGTNLTAYIGQMDKASGASAAVAGFLINLADNIDRVAVYAGTAATAFGTYLVAGFVAANAAAITLSGSLAFLRGALIRTGIGALVVLAGELVYQLLQLKEATGGWGAALDTLRQRAVLTFDGIRFSFLGMTEAMRSAWFDVLADIARGAAQTMGPLLRIMGVSAEEAQKTIAGYERSSKDWADTSRESFGVAADQFAAAAKSIKSAEAPTAALTETTVKAAAAEDELTKAQKRAAAQAADRARQRQEAINQLELDIQLVGKSAAETARLTAEYQFMAEARRDAKGGIIDPSEIAQIKEAADEIGKLTQALALKNAQEELSFERSLLGLSDPEKRIRQDLRGKGIDYASPEGEDLAAQMRYLDNAHKIEDQLKEVHDAGKDAFMDILDALGDGENAIDAMISGLAGLGRAFAKIGQERLFDALSGKGGSIGSFASGFPAAPRIAANDNSDPWEGMRSLSKSLEGTSKSALDVARGFDGLNERADSKVLDGFLRASGNWKGMSAQDTAWCASFANAAIMQSGGQGTGSNLASSFLNWGNATNAPKPGDIVVLKPQSAGASGHVGFVAGFGDGTVQVFGGNQSNGANTKSFGMDQVAGFRTDPRLMSRAVSDGVVDANGRVASMQGGATGIAPAGGGTMGGMGGNAAMAGIGAFAQGYQSGSPLGGAMSGAMAGFSVGGPVGAVAGAIIGGIGGIFGKKSQEKKEQQQAKKELEKQMGAIQEMLDYASGTVAGGIAKAVREFKDETAKAIELATKAGDKKLAKRLKASVGELEARLIKDFKNAYEGTIEGLNLGLGIDNPFKQGFDAVKSLREELLAFVDDAKTAGLALDEAANAASGKAKSAANSNNISDQQAFDLIRRHRAGEDISGFANVTWGRSPFSGGTDEVSPNGVYMERLMAAREAARAQALAKAAQAAGQAEEAERQLSDARKAAVNQALSVLSGATELTEIEQQMMELRGKAAALPPVLEDLGLTAAQAAEQIDKHLTKAIGKMAMDLINDLNASISELSGMGWLNDVIDAQEMYQDRLKDSAALGIDASRANRELSLSLQEIVTGADLTQEQITMLAGAFPDLAAAFGSVLPGGENDITAAMNAVEKARTDLRASYEKEANELQTVIDRTKDFIANIKDFQKSLRVDNTLSPLSSYDRYLEAQKQFRDVSALAATGDEDAMGKLEGVSREYLDEARGYYASSEAYFEAFNEVQAILDRTLSKAEQQLSKDEQQLAALKDQVGKLIDIDDSVKSVADAIAALTTAQKAANSAFGNQLGNVAIDRAYEQALGRPAEQAGLDYWKSQLNSGTSVGSVVNQITNSNEAKIAQMYRDIMGRQGSTKEVSYWLTTGKSLDQIHADLSYAKKMGAYADGGLHEGGLRLVGERGPEIEATGPARIWTANQTRDFMRGGNDNSAVVAELRALRQDNAELRGEVKRLASVVAAGAVQTVEAVREGTAIQADVASDLRKVASR